MLVYSYISVYEKNLTKTAGADNKSQKFHLCTAALGTPSVKEEEMQEMQQQHVLWCLLLFLTSTWNGPSPLSCSDLKLRTIQETLQHTEGQQWQTAELVPIPCPTVTNITACIGESREWNWRKGEQVDECHVFHMYLCAIKHFFLWSSTLSSTQKILSSFSCENTTSFEPAT